MPKKSSHRLLTTVVAFGVLLSIAVGSVLTNVGTVHAAPGQGLKGYAHVENKALPKPNPRSILVGNYQQNRKFNCELPTSVERCFSPEDFYKAYNVNPILNRNITGKGETIVIIDGSQSPTIAQDLQTFDQYFGLPDPTLNVIAPFGLDAFDPNAATEITLDVELAHEYAPDATIDLVLAKQFTFQGVYDVTKYAVDNNLGNIISQSFGGPETCARSYVQAIHQVFQEAANKNITVLASSGDNGAATVLCDANGNQIGIGQGVQTPESDPLVTSVGGTTLFVDSKGNYNDETVWNESVAFASRPFGTNDTGGGGFSVLYPRPSYQAGVSGIGSLRGVPDVSLDASGQSSALIVCSSCGAGANAVFGEGGTSASAPEWAGIVALTDQLAGKQLGFINKAIYKIGKSDNYNNSFHDVLVGNNTYVYTDDNGNLAQVVGYPAEKKWDASTGWGSPNVASLIPRLIRAA